MADTNRVVLSIATKNQWLVYQIDIKYSFLNGILEEEVYVGHLPRYTIEGHEHKVFNLKKTLYALKQPP